MNLSKKGAQLIMIFIIGIAVGYLSAVLMMDKSGYADTQAEKTNITDKTNDPLKDEPIVRSPKDKDTIPVKPAMDESEDQLMYPMNTSEVLVVKDQPAGDAVVVSEVNFDEKVWVVIYEEREGRANEIGNILGAARIHPEAASGTVELVRSTIPGKTYFAVLHENQGGTSFDHKKELPLMSDDGKSILYAVSFQTFPQNR